MTPAADVAVVGGGIVGTATAAFLAEAGLSVVLYERQAIAAGASGRNSGIVQHPFDPVLAACYRASLDEYRAMAAASDGGFQLDDTPAGLLLVGRDAGHVRRLAAAWTTTWPDAGAETVAEQELARLEPGLAGGLVACRLAIGYPTEPAAATDAFAARSARAGVRLAVGDEVRLGWDGDRVTGVVVGGRLEAAGAVVVAAGPWTPEVVDPSGGWRPVRPVWGVVASLALERPPRHALEAADIDIEPAGGGALRHVDFSLVTAGGASVLGSTFLETEPEPADWLAPLRERGAGYVPAVARAPVLGMRHCARPVSVDGRPLVGAVPGRRGLFVAAGHGPWGISTGPGTARMVAEIVTGRRAGPDPGLDPARFGSPGGQPAATGQRPPALG